jgi:hypothetical protein
VQITTRLHRAAWAPQAPGHGGLGAGA